MRVLEIDDVVAVGPNRGPNKRPLRNNRLHTRSQGNARLVEVYLLEFAAQRPKD
jgi:hypothetical protein